jgi:hypothetical protein
MDMFQASLPRTDPNDVAHTYNELNNLILDTKDSNHHGYVMLAKSDSKLVVLHRLSFHLAALGVTNEPWHQKLFAFTGNIVGDQMPQMMQLPSQALDLLPHSVKVAKLAAQLVSLGSDDMHTLDPVATGADTAAFDEVKTQFPMYVPGKYLPLLIMWRITPKEALLVINTKAVAQNEQDLLEPLSDWLRVAVTRSAVDPTAASAVACSALPSMPLMELEFAEKQKILVVDDLPGWSQSHTSGNSAPGQPGGTAGSTTNAILQSLQLLLQQSQTQGTIAPARRIKKPSKHWEGTICTMLKVG